MSVHPPKWATHAGFAGLVVVRPTGEREALTNDELFLPRLRPAVTEAVVREAFPDCTFVYDLLEAATLRQARLPKCCAVMARAVQKGSDCETYGFSVGECDEEIRICGLEVAMHFCPWCGTPVVQPPKQRVVLPPTEATQAP
jgi:hypothetical protein